MTLQSTNVSKNITNLTLINKKDNVNNEKRESEKVEENKIDNSKWESMDIINEKVLDDTYETKITPNEEMKRISDVVLETLDKIKLSQSDKNFSLNHKEFEKSQKAINKAEQTVSAPGSYNKPHKM